MCVFRCGPIRDAAMLLSHTQQVPLRVLTIRALAIRALAICHQPHHAPNIHLDDLWFCRKLGGWRFLPFFRHTTTTIDGSTTQSARICPVLGMDGAARRGVAWLDTVRRAESGLRVRAAQTIASGICGSLGGAGRGGAGLGVRLGPYRGVPHHRDELVLPAYGHPRRPGGGLAAQPRVGPEEVVARDAHAHRGRAAAPEQAVPLGVLRSGRK